VLHHGAEILQVEELQTAVVGDLEDQRQNGALGLVQSEDPRQEERSHLRDGGASGMARLAEHVPEDDRAAGEREIVEPELPDPLRDLGVVATRLGDAREIALHVGEEDRHADRGQLLGQHLQRHGLAGAGGAGDQAVSISHLRQQVEVALALGDEQWLSHSLPFRTPPSPARAGRE
jgi:hypothetical protein